MTIATEAPRFLWGAGTAAHQVEGGNTNNNVWGWEHRADSPFREKSGDACDSYHRWSKDLDAVASMGLNTYRFSLEWSRIEPSEGEFSRAAIDHYRRMIDACADRGLLTVVTAFHFTMPQWLWGGGGLDHPRIIDRFKRYCEFIAPALRENVAYVTTINEANVTNLLYSRMTAGYASADEARLNPTYGDTLAACHRAGREPLRSTGASVGWSVAIHNFVYSAEAGDKAAALAHDSEIAYLEVAHDDDHVGIQTYTRTRLSDEGVQPAPDASRTTQTGWEFYPECVEDAIRLTTSVLPGVPILITENGIATENDDERIEYIDRALAALDRTTADGAPVHGYIHWSALDNFEWVAGYGPKFGLTAVNRKTFERTIKASGYHLGRSAAARRTQRL